MDFKYSDAPQKSPEWFSIRRGKVTASRLSDWLAVSKAKATPGKPLKPRLDYETELMFERQFNTSFETFVTSAMQEGIDYEDFAAQQYAQATGYHIEEVGCWYNDYFVASPDRLVFADNDTGLLEIKIVKDNTFTAILTDGVPDKHLKQIQGQLWASGATWCDYVALNFNTKQFNVMRVYPDKELFEYLALSVQEQLVVAELNTSNLHAIKGPIPTDVTLGAEIDRSDSNIKTGASSWEQ